MERVSERREETEEDRLGSERGEREREREGRRKTGNGDRDTKTQKLARPKSLPNGKAMS